LLRAGNSEIDAMLETRWKRVLEAIGTEPREWLSNP
jgi:flagellar assembly protein FliH